MATRNSKLQKEYEEVIKKNNAIQKATSEKAGIKFTPTTTKVKLPTRRDDGSLTDYGKHITTQVSPDNKGDSNYQAYIEKAQSRGNQFMDYDQYTKSKNTPRLPKSKRNTGTSESYNGVTSTSGPSLADRLAQAQTNAQVARLKQLRDKNLGILDQSVGTTKEGFKDARTDVKTRSDMAAERLRKVLATQGTSGSGAMGQGTIAQNVTRQGNLGSLNKGEATALSDIERRRSDVLSGYETDVEGVRAGTEAQALERTLAEQRRQEDIQREEDRYNMNIARDDEKYAREVARQDEALARAEAQGISEQERNDFLATIDQDSDDFQAKINEIANDNDPGNDWKLPFYRARRQQKIANIEQAESKQLEAQEKARDDAYDNAFKLWKELGTANAEISAILGVREGSRTNDAEYRDAQIALQNRKESRMNSGGGSTKPAKTTKGEVWSAWDLAQDKPADQVQRWLSDNAELIINTVGRDGYNEMLEDVKTKSQSDSSINALQQKYGGTIGR